MPYSLPHFQSSRRVSGGQYVEWANRRYGKKKASCAGVKGMVLCVFLYMHRGVDERTPGRSEQQRSSDMVESTQKQPSAGASKECRVSAEPNAACARQHAEDAAKRKGFLNNERMNRRETWMRKGKGDHTPITSTGTLSTVGFSRFVPGVIVRSGGTIDSLAPPEGVSELGRSEPESGRIPSLLQLSSRYIRGGFPFKSTQNTTSGTLPLAFSKRDSD